jgi:single-strand DNA-binding protein
VVEVVADEIGPSLRWATAQVERNERREPDQGGAPAPVGGGSRPSDSEPPPYDEEPF